MRAALLSLEKVSPADSPEPSLAALKVPKADLRRLALLRLFQRQLLHDPRVQATLRRGGDDDDPEVRRMAFLLSLYTREKLLQALRQRDPELHRQLVELESGTLPALEEMPMKTAPARRPDPPAAPGSGGAALQNLASQIERLGQMGLLPPEKVDQLREQVAQISERGPGSLEPLLAHLRSFFERHFPEEHHS